MVKIRDKLKGSWENLVILDACRFDYFRKVYKDYFEGDLTKVISPGSSTDEFCKKVYSQGDFKDVIYVSANPFLNSYTSVKGCKASSYFLKIYDVWDSGWNRKLRTVPPGEVNRAALKAKENYPTERLIIHYMQPHYPYLTRGGEKGWGQLIDRSTLSTEPIFRLKDRLRIVLAGPVKRILSRKNYWKLLEFLGKDINNPMYPILKEEGIEGLMEAYEENLREVLRYVKNLVKRMPGKTIITSDHGELLGEYKDYGHYPNKHIKELMVVPWFEVQEDGI